MLANFHRRLEVKEFIIMAVANMCRSKAKNLKSGWSVVIEIFTLVGRDDDEHIVMQCFEVLKHAIKSHFILLEEYFELLINCLKKYAESNFLKYALEALELIEECASNVCARREAMLSGPLVLARYQKENWNSVKAS